MGVQARDTQPDATSLPRPRRSPQRARRRAQRSDGAGGDFGAAPRRPPPHPEGHDEGTTSSTREEQTLATGGASHPRRQDPARRRCPGDQERGVEGHHDGAPPEAQMRHRVHGAARSAGTAAHADPSDAQFWRRAEVRRGASAQTYAEIGCAHGGGPVFDAERWERAAVWAPSARPARISQTWGPEGRWPAPPGRYTGSVGGGCRMARHGDRTGAKGASVRT